MTAQVRKTIQNTRQFFYAFTVETPHQVIPIRAGLARMELIEPERMRRRLMNHEPRR